VPRLTGFQSFLFCYHPAALAMSAPVLRNHRNGMAKKTWAKAIQSSFKKNPESERLLTNICNFL
jgi:hypothetical protein